MLNDLFFLEINPQDLVDKIWDVDDDAAHFYQDPAASAEWAIFIGYIYDVEYYVLDGIGGQYGDLEEFFVYVVLENTPFDVSGFHANHQAIVDDNEFYSENYGEVSHRKITQSEAIRIAGSEDVDYLMDILVG